MVTIDISKNNSGFAQNNSGFAKIMKLTRATKEHAAALNQASLLFDLFLSADMSIEHLVLPDRALGL